MFYVAVLVYLFNFCFVFAWLTEYFRACHRVEPGFVGHFPEVSIQIRIAPVIVALVDRNIPSVVKGFFVCLFVCLI